MASLISPLAIFPLNPNSAHNSSITENPLPNLRLSSKTHKLLSRHFLRSQGGSVLRRRASVSCRSLSLSPLESGTRKYEFSDGGTEVELRFHVASLGVESPSDIFVDAGDSSLLIRVKSSGTLRTLMQTDCLFERIKPAETIWYIDEDQLVINLKKHEEELNWPDIMESWESLRIAAPQLLKGTSIYIVGESTEINEEVAKVLAIGIGYTPLSTREVLEKCAGQPVDSWVSTEGAGPVAEAEALALQSLSSNHKSCGSHVRAVVATLGGHHGAATWHDKWRHLYAGFTVWLSKSEAADEAGAREEARRNMEEGSLAYTKADVVVKLEGWDENHTQKVAQGCLSALKRLVLSEKKLTGKKSLYVRLGCRGDWPNIEPPGWDPSTGLGSSSS
ncbi:hypothetical protein KSP39_PZI008115 [Platanthera zijinensis]|uniref:CS domain-containing protein n=1 Tax=Platanthera zijinensis TaxID=2320716 RepID=A0AAP0G986_9ASPA